MDLISLIGRHTLFGSALCLGNRISANPFSNFEYEISERVRIPDFQLAELDWDGDGYVQRREIPKKISRYVKFDKIDRNQDGEIDALESGQIDSLVEGARERIHLRRNDQGEVKLLNDAELLGNWTVRMREEGSEVQKSAPIAELFMTRYEGVLQGNFGQSTRYGESVLQVISERLPVSTYFGILTFIITYIICIPLGVFKAVRHNQLSDDLTSILIFCWLCRAGVRSWFSSASVFICEFGSFTNGGISQ